MSMSMSMSMTMREACPECGSQQFKKNGPIHTGKQNHQCKACGRQFVLDTTRQVIDDAHRRVVERLLCEKISLQGICRAIGVSIRWLMDFMVARLVLVQISIFGPIWQASDAISPK